VLTKPIGSGILTHAAKAGHIGEDELEEAVSVMIHLNRGASEAMIEVGVHAATDITGFGLIGHAFEVADASKVTLEIEAASVPLMRRTMEFAAKGIVTRAHKEAKTHLGEHLHVGKDVDPVLVNVLCDAQTSGGLLIFLAEERADALLAALNQRGTPCAAIIGRVVSRRQHAIILT
jgi:selenide,water dikinase